MTVEILEPDGVGRPIAHYSMATRSGHRIYVAGLIAITPEGDIVGRGNPREQMRYICETLKTICSQYGAQLANVSQCLVFISDRAYYRDVDEAFSEAFSTHRPARATVVARLVHDDFLVELTNVTLEL